jgi:hypothetical protein
MTNISPETVKAAAKALQLDVITAEVVSALEQAAVGVLLLKGPSILRRLYGRDHRSYIDIDLLVEPRCWSVAVGVLEALGFLPVHPGARRTETASHSKDFQRQDVALDLHYTLSGVSVSDEEAWDHLVAQTVAVEVGGRPMTCLNDTGLALHIALHSVQNGRRTQQTDEDLRRAVTMIPVQAWREASHLARQLHCDDHFAAGLRLCPEGRQIASELQLDQPSRLARLKGSAAPQDVIWIEQLAVMPSWRAKATTVLWELFPSRGGLLVVSPLARRGPLGVAAAYLLRPFIVAFRGAIALVQWRKLRRSARSS